MLFIVSVTNSFAQNDIDPQVMNKLSAYNENSTSKTLIATAERKWWQAVLDFCFVAGADIAGAYGGVQASSGAIAAIGLSTAGTGAVIVGGISAVVGGAGASRGAYLALRTSQPLRIGFGNLNINIPNGYEYLANTGRTHNEVLHNYFFNTGDINQFYNSVLTTPEQMQVIHHPILSEAKAQILESATSYANNGYSFESLSADLVSKNLMSRTGKSILDVFNQKYRRCDSPESMKGLINYYLSEIASSTLSSLEKRSVISALLVASESPFYMTAR